jgi:hypothetical protein
MTTVREIIKTKMKEKLLIFLTALQKGNHLKNPEVWKTRTIKANVISAIAILLLVLSVFFGMELNLSGEEVALIATGVIWLFNSLNNLMCLATTDKIGLRPRINNEQTADSERDKTGGT